MHTKALTPLVYAVTGSIKFTCASMWQQILNKCAHIKVRYGELNLDCCLGFENLMFSLNCAGINSIVVNIHRRRTWFLI